MSYSGVKNASRNADLVNYIENGKALNGTAGWATYADAAGAAPVDGTGGSPTAGLFVVSSSSPLRGSTSFNLVKPASNIQGQGASYDFTIDNADKAKVLTVTFDYELVSGALSDGNLVVYIYDKDSSQLIQPAGYTVLGTGSTGVKMRQIATFQTSSSSTNYRLIVHVATTSTSAATVSIDTVRVGPQTALYGAPVTDWQDYTATPSPSGFTVSSYSEKKYRRVGDCVQVRITGTIATITGGMSIANFLPPGLSIDTTKVTAASILGTIWGFDVSLSLSYQGMAFPLDPPSGSAVRFISGTGSSVIWSTTSPFIWAAGDIFGLEVTIPVSGWSSSVLMSNDTDTRVVAARYGVSGTRTPTTSKAVNYDSKIFDTHGAVTTVSGDIAGWKFTAPVSGFYEASITSAVSAGATTNSIYIYLNGVQNIALSTAADTNLHSGSGVVEMKAGEYLDIRSDGTPTLNGNALFNSISIRRLSGPATIAASETVAAAYYNVGGQIIPQAAATTITTWTKEVDTHGFFNGSTGIATIPVNGIYQVSLQAAYDSTTTTPIWYIRKNSTTVAISYTPTTRSAAETTGPIPKTLRLTAGDTISFLGFHNTAGTIRINADALEVYMSITRVGN